SGTHSWEYWGAQLNAMKSDLQQPLVVVAARPSPIRCAGCCRWWCRRWGWRPAPAAGQTSSR
ncbi:hypothetical protein, partial [Mycobacterium shinjukuense]|uniref:hypothetical protein n=1 Tax=Mycobacterium shinjukuense TaxID=398694 RepID=UPI00114E04CE